MYSHMSNLSITEKDINYKTNFEKFGQIDKYAKYHKNKTLLKSESQKQFSKLLSDCYSEDSSPKKVTFHGDTDICSQVGELVQSPTKSAQRKFE